MYDGPPRSWSRSSRRSRAWEQVGVGGASLPAVRVEVNPTQLNSYGLTLANVRSVLSLQNSDHGARAALRWHVHRGHSRPTIRFPRPTNTSR